MKYIINSIHLIKHFGFIIFLDDLLFRINRRISPLYGESIFTYLKYRNIRRYLIKKYGYIIDRYKKIDNTNWNGESITSDCPLWVFWAQGIDESPSIVYECIRSIEKFNGIHPLIILSNSNYSEYVTLPDVIIEKYNHGLISPTHFSDILRFALLKEHGGIWLDACSFMIGDSFFVEAEKYSYYSIKGTDTAINYSDHLWILSAFAAGQNNKYVELIYNLLIEYFTRENYLIDYFVTSEFEMASFEKIPALRDMMFAYPANNQNYYSLRDSFDNDFNAEYFKHISSNTDIFNLTWKVKRQANDHSYLNHLLAINNK